MRYARFLSIAGAVGITIALIAGCSSGGGSSKSSSKSSGTTGITAPAATGTPISITVSDTSGLSGPMTMTVSPATAPAGDVTFTVKNTGTIDHEAVVLKTNVAYDQIPITGFQGEPNRISESSKVGETGDPTLKPGQTRSFTVKNMAAGTYAIVCNIADHYKMGMRAPFTVV